MPSQSLYLPKDDDGSFEPDADDLEFASAFLLLATAVDSSDHSEDLLLRLSTCRNAYMTVNTLFVALAKLLGHGGRPSLLAQCNNYLQTGDFKRLRQTIDQDVFGILRDFSRKVDVWHRRKEFEDELDRAIKSLPSKVDQDRLAAILSNIRTEMDGRGRIDGRFIAIATDEPSYLGEYITFLDNIYHQVFSVVKVLLPASEVTLPSVQGPTLFDDDESMRIDETQWKKLYNAMAEHAVSIGIRSEPSAGTVTLVDSKLTPTTFSQTSPTISEVRQILSALHDHIDKFRGEVHRSLNEKFRPNFAHRPLPDLFKIDLREPQPSESHEVVAPLVNVVPLGGPKPATFRLALPKFGFPRQWYREGSFMRLKDERINDVERVLESSIVNAASNNAAVLILPEYVIPRRSSGRLSEIAQDKGIALIGGLEASTSPNHDGNNLLINEAVIRLPEVNYTYLYKYAQRKRSASVYESELARDCEFLLFKGSRLGTFAVLVCSDFRELDILSAFATTREPIDVLFVCSMNRHPRLFEQLAVADAHRLHACVVISNNCFGNDVDKATNDGSASFWPRHSGPEQINRGDFEISLGLPDIAELPAAIALQDVCIANLERTSAKPPRGFLPVPRCRQVSGF